jgi:hypothetical protein
MFLLSHIERHGIYGGCLMNVPSLTERARFCVGESESYGRRGVRLRTLLLVESMSSGLNTSVRGRAIGEGVWTIWASTCEII